LTQKDLAQVQPFYCSSDPGIEDTRKATSSAIVRTREGCSQPTNSRQDGEGVRSKASWFELSFKRTSGLRFTSLII
jgi:hypothetical protein